MLRDRIDQLENELKSVKSELKSVKSELKSVQSTFNDYVQKEKFFNMVADLIDRFYEAFLWHYFKNNPKGTDKFLEKYFSIFNNESGTECLEIEDEEFKKILKKEFRHALFDGYDVNIKESRMKMIEILNKKQLHGKIFQFMNSKSSSFIEHLDDFLIWTDFKQERNSSSHDNIPYYNSAKFKECIKDRKKSFNTCDANFESHHKTAIRTLFKVFLDY
jgi:hypothetical protein